MSNLFIGTSGWNYPGGRGTWNGVFYPATKGRPKGFDELAFYAEHFCTVEVNSTFYGQPRSDVTRGWVSRTPNGFEFSLKLYQKFTHSRMFRERLEHTLPPDAAAEPALEALAEPNQADLDEFRRGIDPLMDAGRLGAVLAQFPPSFKRDPPSVDRLGGLLRDFAGYPIAVELRHKSWSDDVAGTISLLNEFDAAWVQIDEPKFKLSIRQNHLPNVRTFYYMRLHGRNAKQWWQQGSTEDRYDYLYSRDELAEFADVAGAARALVKKVYLYTNNHFAAKSVANAAMLKDALGDQPTGEYSEEFVGRYPALRNVVRVRTVERGIQPSLPSS
jgi:uncharacterized protein YecE (DUF72 family)